MMMITRDYEVPQGCHEDVVDDAILATKVTSLQKSAQVRRKSAPVNEARLSAK